MKTRNSEHDLREAVAMGDSSAAKLLGAALINGSYGYFAIEEGARLLWLAYSEGVSEAGLELALANIEARNAAGLQDGERRTILLGFAQSGDPAATLEFVYSFNDLPVSELKQLLEGVADRSVEAREMLERM